MAIAAVNFLAWLFRHEPEGVMNYERRILLVQRVAVAASSRSSARSGSSSSFAMCLGAATFNLLGSLLGGVLMFLLLYYSAARWATATDPQILKLLFSRGKVSP